MSSTELKSEKKKGNIFYHYPQWYYVEDQFQIQNQNLENMKKNHYLNKNENLKFSNYACVKTHQKNYQMIQMLEDNSKQSRSINKQKIKPVILQGLQ